MSHLEAFLTALRADAALIHRPENMRWLANYTGEGCLFICARARVLLTDSRYTEQARQQCPGWTVEQLGPERDYSARIAGLCGEYAVANALVETDYLTYDAYQALALALKGVELAPMGEILRSLREVKDEAEIASIRRAAAITSEAFDNVLPRLRPGLTERQVRQMLEFEMLELGSEGTAFETIVAAGVNGALPHAKPSDHVLARGELLTMDFGAKADGYCADMTRTVGIGHIEGELRRVYDTVREAQQLGLEALAVGRACGEVDKAVRDFIDARYPGAFGHGLGHGVGLYIHEQPWLRAANTEVLKVGHVLTVEPGVYVPGLGGCRIEDTVIMTGDGAVNAIAASKHLIEL